MIRNKHEQELRPWRCPKVQAFVRIAYRIILHGSGTELGFDNRDEFAHDCNTKSLCGVQTESDTGFTVDWMKCAHPDLKRL